MILGHRALLYLALRAGKTLSQGIQRDVAANSGIHLLDYIGNSVRSLAKAPLLLAGPAFDKFSLLDSRQLRKIRGGCRSIYVQILCRCSIGFSRAHLFRLCRESSVQERRSEIERDA